MSNINDWKNHPLCKKINGEKLSYNVGVSIIKYLNIYTNSLKYEYRPAIPENDDTSQILKNGEILFSWRPLIDKLEGRWTKLLILIETEELIHKLELLYD